MDRRVVVVGAALLLLSAVVVVQILDPQLGGRERPPEVDFSEPPNEVAADAAKQFEYVDYAYRVDTRYNGSDGWRQWGVTWVDHTNRSYRSVGPGGVSQEMIYGTVSVGFVRRSIDADWIVVSRAEFEYPSKFLTQPTNVERLRNADARVLAEGPSTVTIHAEVNPVKVVGRYPGSAMIVVNKTSGRIEKINVAYKLGQTRTRYLRFRVIETETIVERPEAIGISPKEVILDLIRGPLFRVI